MILLKGTCQVYLRLFDEELSEELHWHFFDVIMFNVMVRFRENCSTTYTYQYFSEKKPIEIVNEEE
jgi:hypothetical protein